METKVSGSAFPQKCLSVQVSTPWLSVPPQTCAQVLLCSTKSGQLLPRAAFYLQNPQNVLERGRSGTKLIKPSSQSQPHLSTHRQRDEGTSFASRPEIISRRRATLKSKTGWKYQNITESSQNSTRCQDKFSIPLYISLINLC